MASLSFNTVQELISGGYSITAWCKDTDCRHNAVLDLEKLKAKLGPNHSTLHQHLTPKLKCARCKGKDVGLILSPPTHRGTPYEGWKR